LLRSIGLVPSDTLSTHLLHPPGAAALKRWGLLDQLTATGCPPIDTYAFDFGPFTIAGAPGTVDAPVAYCPRRTVLDQLLVDAASEAGAEVREEFSVEDVVIDNDRVVGIRGHGKDRQSVTEYADVVVGADGRYSRVAAAVRAAQYNERPEILCGYYSYWSNLPIDGKFEVYIRPERGWAVAPTHDGLTLVVAGWPYAELEANRSDVEGNYLKMFDLAQVRRAHPRRERRRASRVRPSRTTSASPTDPAGRWSATPDTARISSPRRASPMRFETPSCVPARCTVAVSGLGTSTLRWASTTPPGTITSCRCSSSPANWQRSSRRRPKCSNSSEPCTAIGRRASGAWAASMRESLARGFFSEETWSASLRPTEPTTFIRALQQVDGQGGGQEKSSAPWPRPVVGEKYS
jgi:hypothetical protein